MGRSRPPRFDNCAYLPNGQNAVEMADSISSAIDNNPSCGTFAYAYHSAGSADFVIGDGWGPSYLAVGTRDVSGCLNEDPIAGCEVNASPYSCTFNPTISLVSQPVPTVGAWGIVGLVALLVGTGRFLVWRRAA